MSTPRAPQGWTVELLGLAASVTFEQDGRRLTWSDGRWYRETRTQDGAWLTVPAPGVGQASTMQEARAEGCAFLHRMEEHTYA